MMTQPQNEPPSKVDAFIENVRKLLIPSGATAGVAGAFWSLFGAAESDFSKALVSVSIGFALSIGSYLLGPIANSTKRRAKHAGEKFDQVTEQVIAAATGFEEKYLCCQASDCESVRAEGMRQQEGIFEPLLKDVFVELQIDGSTRLPGFQADVLTRQTLGKRSLEGRLRQTIWDFLAVSRREKAYRQLAILAWGGYGKTTLLKHVAYRYGMGDLPEGVPKLVPVLVVLRKYREVWTKGSLPDLAEFIVQHHIKSLPEAHRLQPVPPNWAQSLLQKGRALVMFDGFDEVPRAERPVVAKWINEQMRAYQRSVFVVTSRPKAYKEQDFSERLMMSTPMWVQPFDDGQRRRFVESWYLAQETLKARRDTPEVRKVAAAGSRDLLQQIEAKLELKDLAKNPLLLNMIATFHRLYPGAALPKRRVDLYGEICDLQLKARPRDRRLETVLLSFNPQPVLEEIAFGMMQRTLKRIDKKLLVQEIAKVLVAQDETVDAAELLHDVVLISELMVEQEDEYEFAHLSFQEYLASSYVAAQPDDREWLLYEQFTNDWWKATILLYAGKTKKPSRLIRQAMQQGNDDLAYACWQQTTKRVDEGLQAELIELKTVLERVKHARYADLERYLKNGEWEQADEETHRLMITEVGKEEGEFFSREDLLNFPGDPLKTIDSLWVKHSSGKFGFSVQKKIYMACGGLPDGKYDEQAWNKFCETSGWRSNGHWVSVRFDASSPKGHLPFSKKTGWISLLSHPVL